MFVHVEDGGVFWTEFKDGSENENGRDRQTLSSVLEKEINSKRIIILLQYMLFFISFYVLFFN